MKEITQSVRTIRFRRRQECPLHLESKKKKKQLNTYISI